MEFTKFSETKSKREMQKFTESLNKKIISLPIRSKVKNPIGFVDERCLTFLNIGKGCVFAEIPL